MRSYSDHGIVLRKRPLKEKDELIVLLTPQRGKVALMSYGSRDPKSRKSGIVELFNTIQFEARQSKAKLSTLQQAKLVTSRGYQVVAGDQSLDEFYRASEMVKLTDQYLHEEQDVQNVYNDLHEALAFIKTSSVHLIYWVRLLSDLGFLPDWSACSLCQEKLDLEQGLVFDGAHKGFAHQHCLRAGAKQVSAELVKVMHYWQRSALVDGAKVDVGGETQSAIRDILETLEFH